MSSTKPVYKPTDYARGTVMQPEHISTLRASFGEYEALGQQHRDLTERIDSLREKMKMSRQRGAFQTLQEQMREVKTLVKEREDIDAKMAVADLARKKDDDHRLAVKQEVSYSEQINSVANRIAELELMMLSFAEPKEDNYDFTRCQRPDGSFYGTRGKCKKGAEAGVAAPAQIKEKAISGAAKPKKAIPKRGPLHKEVMEARQKLQEVLPELKARQQELSRLERAGAAQTKKVKQEPSKENRERLKLVNQAIRSQEQAVRRHQREVDRLTKEWYRLHKRNERAKMSPQQLAAERALDREIRLRG